MAADELAVLGEGDVALDDAGSHARARLVGFLRVLGELHGRTAVRNGEVTAMERAVLAAQEPGLERTVIHALHEKEGAWPELHTGVPPAAEFRLPSLGSVGRHFPGRADSQQDGYECGSNEWLAVHDRCLAVGKVARAPDPPARAAKSGQRECQARDRSLNAPLRGFAAEPLVARAEQLVPGEPARRGGMR